MKEKNNYDTFFVLLLGAMSFTTCSVSPEDTPGLCTLSCESAKIVGSDPSFKIIKNSNDMQFTCSANQANQALNPTLVYFTIVRSIEQVNVDGTVGGTRIISLFHMAVLSLS